MKHLKYFESIRDEYPEMFGKNDYIPDTLDGFGGGTIDPTDDVMSGGIKSEKEIYVDFLKATTEKNFKETKDKIIIDVKTLYENFYMSIYGARKHFKDFITEKLVGMYISEGVTDYDGNSYEGIVENLSFTFDGYSAFLVPKFENQKYNDDLLLQIVTLDKLKSTINKYNM